MKLINADTVLNLLRQEAHFADMENNASTVNALKYLINKIQNEVIDE